MMRRTLLLACLLAVPALAGELHGVKMPDTATVDGKTLKLNGMGVRMKFVFQVYIGGLYLETPSKEPGKILAADEARRVDMHFMRDVDRKAMVEALVNSITANTSDKGAAVKDRMDKLMEAFQDIKKGQVVSVIYSPGKGTRIEGGKAMNYTAEGKDFADAIFAAWLGKNPADEGLKKGMLGN